MKMFVVGSIVAITAIVVVQFASSAPSGSSVAIPRRVQALETKVKVLTATVKTLKSDVARLDISAAARSARTMAVASPGVIAVGIANKRRIIAAVIMCAQTRGAVGVAAGF